MKEYRGKFASHEGCLFGFRHAELKISIAVAVVATTLAIALPTHQPKPAKFVPEFTAEPELELEAVSTQLIETELETAVPEDSDVVLLARLADSVARGRSDEVKKIVMWVAINRAEDRSHGYGGSLRDEINRPKQWQQFDPGATYLESTLLLADEVYKTWKYDGPRPIYGDMLWFVLNGDGSITVRNQFKDGKNRVEATFGQ